MCSSYFQQGMALRATCIDVTLIRDEQIDEDFEIVGAHLLIGFQQRVKIGRNALCSFDSKKTFYPGLRPDFVWTLGIEYSFGGD